MICISHFAKSLFETREILMLRHSVLTLTQALSPLLALAHICPPPVEAVGQALQLLVSGAQHPTHHLLRQLLVAVSSVYFESVYERLVLSVLLYFFLQIEVLQSQVPSLHGHGSGAPLVFLVDVVLLRSVVPLEEVRSEFARLYVLDQN